MPECKSLALQEELGFLKTWTTILAAFVAGIFSWIVAHFRDGQWIELVGAVSLLVVFLWGLIHVTLRVKVILRHLEGE